jgi:hypothetical protein
MPRCTEQEVWHRHYQIDNFLIGSTPAPIDQPPRPRHGVEDVIGEIFWRESAADSLLQTADAKTAAPGLDLRSLPDGVSYRVHLAFVGDPPPELPVTLQWPLCCLSRRQTGVSVASTVDADIVRPSLIEQPLNGMRPAIA